MNGNRHSVFKRFAALLVCGLWSGLASSIPVMHDEPPRVELFEPQKWSTWQEYAVYLVSRQLCDTTRNDESVWANRACFSVIAGMATEAAATQTPYYPEYVFEGSGWQDASLLAKADLPFSESLIEARLGFPDGQTDSSSTASATRPEPELEKSPATGDSTVKEAIPGSLLVTILALVGIVAVARRDIPGKDTVRSAAEPQAEVASVSRLRHSASQYGRLHQ